MKKYLINLCIGFDQLCNAIICGDPDETISSRIGKIKRSYDGVIPWYRPMLKIIEYSLDKIDPNHSIKAIEEDEGKDSIL